MRNCNDGADMPCSSFARVRACTTEHEFYGRHGRVVRQLGRISERRPILWLLELGANRGNSQPCFNGNMNTKTKIKAPECLCGCGGRTKGGRFLPGHDAKLKKALIAEARAGKKRARNKLEKLGWS